MTNFVDKARRRIGRDVRALENLTTANITGFSSGIAALPGDFAEIRRVTKSGGTVDLSEIPINQVSAWGNVGTPSVFAVSTTNLWVPGAGSSDVYVVEYWAIPAAMTADGDSALGMNEWPYIWQSAALAEAAFFVQNTDLYQQCVQRYTSEVGMLNAAARSRLSPASTVTPNVVYNTSPAIL